MMDYGQKELYILNKIKTDQMEKEYEAEFIYRPPSSVGMETGLSLDERYIINKSASDRMQLQEEFGSSQPVRVFTKSEFTETECLDCDAKSLAFALEGMANDDPATVAKLKEAVLFILYNTDWPVGD